MENDGIFKKLVEVSNDTIIIFNQDLVVQYASDSLSKNLNLEPVDFIGEAITELIDHDKIQLWLKRLRSGENLFTEEIHVGQRNETKQFFDVEVSYIPQQLGAGLFTLKLHDITSRKEKQVELERTNLQLDQVIYKTTHDLKAPLMSALGLISVAEKSPYEEHNKYFTLIKNSVLKLDLFIEEMNNFFRNEKLALQRDKINITQLLQDEFKNLENFKQELPVAIDFQVTGDVEFYSDLIRLKTIITNILSNALKYSDVKKLKPFIHISVSLSEEFCELSIVDNGIGIEPDFQNKIFDLFFRGTTQSHGTGLGLFIVKDTIEKLGGTIDVKSVLGQGTTFAIRVPNQILQPLEVD